jgi:hypothetical protein
MNTSFCRHLLALALFCGASSSSLGQESDPATVTFCDLLNNPERYNGRVVTVRATYKYGYEWSYLYCLSCRDKGRVWLEFPVDLDASATKALKRAPKYAGIVNVTVEGTFIKCRGCGHLNAYPFQLTGNKASNVSVLIKGMKGPDEEEAAEKRWACGGTNPK